MRRGALAACFLLLASASASHAPGAAEAGPPPLAPLVVNWREYFEIDWQVSARAGRPLLSGHVRSVRKYGARWMQLLVDRVDARGALIDQRLVWLTTEIARGARVYFEVGVEPAASYRVAVFAFEPPDRP
jgi:hypothetical protein